MESTLHLNYFLMCNHVTPQIEIVYETTIMLQFDNCYVLYIQQAAL